MESGLFITTPEGTFRIETFKDEKVSITSSIQNVNDISKVFTDYSQTFSIPASTNNDRIFKHWYENTVTNGFDQRINYNGFIEIDTLIFRFGRWRLDSVKIKNGRPENYRITFFGVLKSLTDLFKDDKLSDVTEMDQYSFDYTGAEVGNIIQSPTDLDVMFPLISSNRFWRYGIDDDISVSGGAIDYKELSPALKINKIFDAIASKYGLVFSGDFLSQSRFTQAYLWLKNRDVLNPLSSFTRPDLVSSSVNSNYIELRSDLINNTWSFYLDLLSGDTYQQIRHSVFVNFASAVNYKINIIRDGDLYLTSTGYGFSSNDLILPQDQNVDYKIEVQTDASVDYEVTVDASVRVVENTDPNEPYFLATSEINVSGSIVFSLSLAELSPDIKVSDFFSGILKMFNLTAISTDGINFNLEQIEAWYEKGEIKDFSKYCEPNYELDRVKSYNAINLEYQESKSILNDEYFEENGLKHGDLTYELQNDGSDYTVKLPFENMIFDKFDGTNLAISYAIDKEQKPYIPKPVILYKYERKDTSFYFNDGNTNELINNYNVFGQDVKYLDEIHSLNFGVEVSQYLRQPINNTLFRDYYLAYLKNLYELKSRMLKIKMRLPYIELIRLKLNDRLIIREKRYLINQYSTDLQTFECDFELIEDLRDYDSLPINPDDVINCQLSEWSPYSECSNGTKTRTRTVLVNPSGGGTECGVLSETISCIETDNYVFQDGNNANFQNNNNIIFK
jgi:hypothetical protein